MTTTLTSVASPRTPITCLSSPLIILTFTVSNGSLGKVSASSPQIPQTRTSLTIPLCHLQKTPPRSINSLWIQVSAPIGSWPYNRPRCKTCPFHHPANSFTSSCTNLTYPITTHPDFKSMNLIYQLQFTECNAFYIGETCRSISNHMNDTALSPQYQTQTCQLPFTPNPTRSLSRNADLLVSYMKCITPPLTTFAVSLKQHTNSSSNHCHILPRCQHLLTPPPFFHSHSSTYNHLSVFSTLLLKRATVFSQKLLLRFLSTLCGPDDVNPAV